MKKSRHQKDVELMRSIFATDPSIRIQLYLAGALDAVGEKEEAKEHYEACATRCHGDELERTFCLLSLSKAVSNGKQSWHYLMQANSRRDVDMTSELCRHMKKSGPIFVRRYETGQIKFRSSSPVCFI